MARRRMIDPNIWQSEDVSKMSVFARFMLIGMISNADDYGKGRASTAFLRSAIFPYDDIRIADIEKALSEISQNISVILYEQAGNKYYLFVNWKKWQTVDHPTDSLIPDPTKAQIANHSRNTLESFPPNIREENVREKKRREGVFVPPTLEEIKAHCKLKKYSVDPQTFYDYFTESNWIDSKGNKVKSWKSKLITWESHNSNQKGAQNAGEWDDIPGIMRL